MQRACLINLLHMWPLPFYCIPSVPYWDTYFTTNDKLTTQCLMYTSVYRRINMSFSFGSVNKVYHVKNLSYPEEPVLGPCWNQCTVDPLIDWIRAK